LPALVLALTANASAETLKWNGSVDSDWNEPDNWDDATINTGVPGSADKASIRLAAPTPVINSPTPGVNQVDLASALDIENGGTLTVNSWMIVGYNSNDSGTFNVNWGQPP